MAEKSVNTKQLRSMSDSDMGGELQKLRQELWQFRLKSKEGSTLQTHRLRFIRRQVARIQTVLTEKRSAGIKQG